MLVASSRPPRPTSITLISQRFLANCRNAIAVMNSKKLGRSSWPPRPRSGRRRAAARPQGRDLVLREEPPVDLHPLPQADKVRRGVEAGPLAGRPQDRLEHRRDGSLAVGAGDVDARDGPLGVPIPPRGAACGRRRISRRPSSGRTDIPGSPDIRPAAVRTPFPGASGARGTGSFFRKSAEAGPEGGRACRSGSRSGRQGRA
jgi:hypothetical protein